MEHGTDTSRSVPDIYNNINPFYSLTHHNIMEKQTQIPLNRGKEVIYGIGITLLLVLAGMFYLSIPVEAKEEYIPQSPLAQELYDKTLEAHKLAECGLVEAKFRDFAESAIKLSGEDLVGLAEKRDICNGDFQ